MANVIINDTNLTNIANAIRNKTGSTNTYKPSEMAGAINSITTGSGGGESETYISAGVANGVVGKMNSGSYYNQIDFSKTLPEVNLFTNMNWILIFSMKINGIYYVWKYDAKSKSYISVSSKGNAPTNTKNLFTMTSSYDGTSSTYFTTKFPSGLIIEEHKVYLSAAEVDSSNQFDADFMPVIYVYE